PSLARRLPSHLHPLRVVRGRDRSAAPARGGASWLTACATYTAAAATTPANTSTPGRSARPSPPPRLTGWTTGPFYGGSGRTGRTPQPRHPKDRTWRPPMREPFLDDINRELTKLR